MEKTVLVTDKEPDVVGRVGKAWKEESPKKETSTCSWIVFAPDAHPLWDYYFISCVSLADFAGVTPAKKYNKDATHEIIVIALDPAQIPTVNDINVIRILTPINFMGQWKEENDDSARTTIEKTVRDIVDGILSPDTDWISQWVSRFGDYGLKGGYSE
jgi:hypothetical protein